MDEVCVCSSVLQTVHSFEITFDALSIYISIYMLVINSSNATALCANLWSLQIVSINL